MSDIDERQKNPETYNIESNQYSDIEEINENTGVESEGAYENKAEENKEPGREFSQTEETNNPYLKKQEQINTPYQPQQSFSNPQYYHAQSTQQNFNQQYRQPQNAQQGFNQQYRQPQNTQQNFNQQYRQPQNTQQGFNQQYRQPQNAQQGFNQQYRQPQNTQQSFSQQYNQHYQTQQQEYYTYPKNLNKYPYQPNIIYPMENRKTPGKGFSIASLVMGILDAVFLAYFLFIVSIFRIFMGPYTSVISGCIGFSLYILIFTALGLIFGFLSRHYGCKNGMSLAGLILSGSSVFMLVMAIMFLILI